MISNLPTYSAGDGRINEKFIEAVLPFSKLLLLYHDHRVHNIERIPKSGPCILLFNHSLATYEVVLLFHRILEEHNRLPRPLIDHLFYKLPRLGKLMDEVGCAEGCPNEALKLLARGELVTIAPGGMREALRPSSSKNQLLWDDRKGFARLAIESQAPVVIALCPRADDLFRVYESRATDWFYDKFRLPFFLARGIGPSLIPRPIKLEHFISKTIIPPVKSKSSAQQKRQVTLFQKKVVRFAQAFMAETLKKSTDP